MAYKGFKYIVDPIIRFLVNMISVVDDREMRKIPCTGPLILVVNHINFLEAPLMYVRLKPRKVTALAKKETWDSLFLGLLADLWEAIPIDREKTSFESFKMTAQALADNRIVVIAPEGTRSGDGRLLPGKAGVVTVATRLKVPILPVVHFGGENVWDNLKRLRRTKVKIKVGRPFRFNCRPIKSTRETMVRELMYQLALLLPPKYRGHYANMDHYSDDFLEFL